jgi:hypothetical protein
MPPQKRTASDSLNVSKKKKPDEASIVASVNKLSPELRDFAFKNYQMIEALVEAEQGDEPEVRIGRGEDFFTGLARVDDNGVVSIYCFGDTVFRELSIFWKVLSGEFTKKGRTVRLVLDFCVLLAMHKEQGKERWPMRWRGRKHAFLLTNEAPEPQTEITSEMEQIGIRNTFTGAIQDGDYYIIKRQGDFRREYEVQTISAQVLPGKTVDVVRTLPIGLLDSCIRAYDKVWRDVRGGHFVTHLDVRIGPMKIVACDLDS